MSETSNPQASTPQLPEEFHWAVTYLREDIQDTGNETRGVHGRIDEKHELLTKRLDNRFALLMTTMVALAGVIVAMIKI